MNVYDEAHNLTRAIKESEEYKQYIASKEKIEQKPELDKMLKDFQNKQFAIQAKQMTGEAITDDMQKQLQELYGIIVQDPEAANYLQCQLRFSMMMNDIYKILGETVMSEKELKAAAGNGVQ